MKRREWWSAIVISVLAAVSWLIAFFVLGGSTAEATPVDHTEVRNARPASEHIVASSTLYPTDRSVPKSDPGAWCGDWVIETVDNIGEVGQHGSLVLEPSEPHTPHISYLDATSQSLKYAWLSGTTWISETVDDGCGKTSLALVPTAPHTPVISYDGCERHTKLAWPEAADWVSNTVPGLDAGGASLALELTRPYTPHISYHWSWNAQSLFHAYLSGTTWLSGTWNYEPVEPSGSKAGRSSSLALELTSPYTPHISYRSRIGDSDLRYAWLSGTTWLTQTVDSAGDVGLHTSLALDSSANPHISYFDDTNNALKYAWLSGTTWISETIDHIGEPPYDRGRSSLALDQSDLPYISYYDAAHGALKLAYSDGTTWFTQTVDSTEDVGQYSSLALDERGCPHISYYDVTNGALKYAHRSPVKVYLPLVTRNSPPPHPYYYESPSLKANCTWTGVWGYVRAADGLPQPNVQLRVGNWQGWRDDTWTDTNGRYSYRFADYPRAGSWFVQVFTAGHPSSQQLWWDTTANCSGGDAGQEFQVDWRHR